jgi:hypothetical protein
MAVAEKFLNEGIIRACRIFSIFSTAVIFSLRSKPKFVKNITVDREGSATPDGHVQFVLCEFLIHQERISMFGK